MEECKNTEQPLNDSNKKLLSILSDLDNKIITKHQAYDLILGLPEVINNEVVVCPRCKGENQYFKRKYGYQCAYTDCRHEWTV